MDVSDLPGPAIILPSHTPTGCTLHVFEGETTIRVSPIRIANGDWPPAMLFDTAYAFVALGTLDIEGAAVL